MFTASLGAVSGQVKSQRIRIRARKRNLAQGFGEQTAGGVHIVVVNRQAEQFTQLVDREACGHSEHTIAEVFHLNFTAVVLIGEVRDHETAQIAVEAALTGHLVLSTLHTNDAPSALTRLTEMGIEPFLVGSALDCVLAQRLARRLCGKCKEPYVATPEELTAARFPWQQGEDLPVLYRPVGCSACAKTGYKGRLALHEVMAVSEEIERLAVQRASATEVANVAYSQGMHSLRADGLIKVGQGITSLEEILRVVV